MEYDITVIMPFYNVKKYIRNAIESIENQTIRNKCQFIAVDDGSFDGSNLIVKEYADIELMTKTNGGASSARNYGLKKALGKYIYFMDSDDTLREDALEIMLKACEENDLDEVIMSPDNYVDMQPGMMDKMYETDYKGVMTGKAMFDVYGKYRVHFCSGPPYRMTKRSFLEDNKISFTEGIIYEDELFTFEILMKAKRVMMVKEVLYYENKRPTSVTASTAQKRRFLSYVTIVKKLEAMDYKSGDNKSQEKTIKIYLKERYNECIDFYFSMNKEDRALLKHEYKAVRKIAQSNKGYGDIKVLIMSRFSFLYNIYYKMIGM